jgi:PAS domain S-box-containing protein
MLALIGLIAAWTLREVYGADSWVDHTYEVMRTSEQLFSELQDAQIAVRGYLLSSEDSDLAPYHTAIAKIPESFRSLKNLTSDNPTQEQRLDALQPLLTSSINTFAETVRLRKNFGLEAADKARRTEQNRTVADRVLRLSREIQNEEYRLLRERLAIRRVRLWRGLGATLGSALLAVVALVLGTVQVRRAVKQRDSAYRERAESQSTVHALFEAAPQAIIIVDQGGSIIMVNPETERLFGYSLKELEGHPVELLIPEQLRGLHTAHRREYFANPQNRPMGLNLDLKARRKDGSEFPAEISLSSIKTPEGTLAVAFAADVSRRWVDEQAIREQREELRHLAGELMTAEDNERRRIARNLHDDLSQNLASIAIDLGKLATMDSLGGVARQLRPIQRRASEAADSVRRISHQLHPSILDDLGLKVALEEFCNDFEERSGIVTQFTSHNVPDYLPSELSNCVYHIAGECLRNVYRHSRSASAFVDITITGSTLHLQVTDDGIGFKREPSAPRSGIGIATMKERTRLLGGVFELKSAPEEGTRVEVQLPVPTR